MLVLHLTCLLYVICPLHYNRFRCYFGFAVNGYELIYFEERVNLYMFREMGELDTFNIHNCKWNVFFLFCELYHRQLLSVSTSFVKFANILLPFHPGLQLDTFYHLHLVELKLSIEIIFLAES